MPKLRIVLADDHVVVREGLKALLQAQPDMQVVSEAGDGQTAIAQVCALQPDAVVMDVSMPELNGAAATTQISQQWPEIKILVLSVHEDMSYVRQMLMAGAAGYVLKRSAGAVLIQALRTVVAGEVYIDPTLVGRMVVNLTQDSVDQVGQLPAVLSEREREVLRRVALGYSLKEIAAHFSLSVKTVETYKLRASEKLNLKSRTKLVRYAIQQGWLNDDNV